MKSCEVCGVLTTSAVAYFFHLIDHPLGDLADVLEPQLNWPHVSLFRLLMDDWEMGLVQRPTAHDPDGLQAGAPGLRSQH